MGAQFEEAVELDSRYIMHTFARKPVEFVRGEGAVLYDDDGKAYIDFLAGIGVASLGHCHPKVVSAIQEQASKLVHVGNYFYIEHRGELSKRICEMLSAPAAASGLPAGSPEDWRVFYANSGAEANEGAIKLARLWGSEHLDGASGVVSARKSFHGRTLATLAATGQAGKTEPFKPLPAGFAHVPLNDVGALEEALDSDIDGVKPAAVLLECIQGESGVWPCTQEYLEAARELTSERGMLLICDEVQTGFCRTGEYFAFQSFGVVPDVVTMAKGIADGMPMGAFAAKSEVAELMTPGIHGTTFGGSNLACAASDATTSVMCEPGFLEHVREAGERLRAGLSKLPFVTEVRGRGLMNGVSLEKPVAGKLVDAGLEHGFVLNAPGADIVRFLPPLVIEDAQIESLLEALPELYAEACS